MFKLDYNNIVDCAYNREPKRTPLYDHSVGLGVMENILEKKFAHLENGTDEEFE